MIEHLTTLLGSSAAGTDVRLDPASWAALCDLADAQGVLPLLAEHLPAPGDLSEAHTTALRGRVHRAAAADLIREVELRRLVSALADAGVPPLLMKGAHLAYAYYRRPDLRPRSDTDLLIEVGHRGAADSVLTDLGYRHVPQVGSDLIMYQTSYALHRDGSRVHLVDVHWRISNAQQFGRVLGCAEVRRRAEPLPALGPRALGPEPVHALLIACVHRVAHHRDAPRLIWTYDIHLLVSRLDAEAWARLLSLAVERGAAAAVLRGLEVAEAAFGTWVPPPYGEQLARAAEAEGGLPAYAAPGGRHISRVWSDLRAMPSWTSAARLARQHLLPPARYMRDVYAPESAAPLPALYMRRVWRGARRWLGRS